MASATTYSFRAEFWPDVMEFLAIAEGTVTIACSVDLCTPDVEVQIESRLDLGTLVAITDLLNDAHVIRETLRVCPLEVNDLEREYGR